MKEKKLFAVIGLGRFGTSIAQALVAQDAEVLVIDEDEEKINEAMSYATHAIQADATDEKVLTSLGIRNFDVVCVCLGEIQASIMVSMLCIEQGIKMLLVKAQSEIHAKVLYKIGVTKVVFPERDTGLRVAHNLVSSNILDFIELSPDYGIAEMQVPQPWEGKNLQELDFRKKYGLNIVAIRHKNDEINVSPLATDVLKKDDTMIVIGSEDQISHLQDLIAKK